MPGHSNSRGNIGFLKGRYQKNMAAGEKLSAAEFEMVVDGYPNLSVLVRSAQIPAIGRAEIEDFGPNGLKFVQQGPYENSGETTVQAVETIKGEVLKSLYEIVINKKYVNLTLKATPESLAGGAPQGTAWRMEDCKLRCDAIDMSTEDVTALVKVSITITYNWKEPA
ncbi:baseplate protein [Aeromonas dhakensis]|nr:baseplate protein [Aeromonas dhakensis]